MPLLFIFARLPHYLLYYVIGYQKKVVRQHLTQYSPEKPAAETKALEKNLLRKKRGISYLFLENIIKRTASTLALMPLTLLMMPLTLLIKPE
ncbi:MAG: hypothetical protein J7577_18670 [Sphingobacteriaceae bacterium]|nr:hypothetical protein [Sphingobacteriaceae bacterium]